MTTYRQARNARFQRGSGVFNCAVCKRATRDTGNAAVGSELCSECYDLAGMDNECNDNGRAPTERDVKVRDQLLASIASKKGDVQRVIAANDYLFPEGYVLPKQAAAAISSNLARAASKSTPKGKQTMNTQTNSAKSTTVAAFEKAFSKSARNAAKKPSKVVVTKPAAKGSKKAAKPAVQRAAKPSTFDGSAFDKALAAGSEAARKELGACAIVRTIAAVKELERKDVMAIAELLGVNKYTASRQFFLARTAS